VRSLLVAVSGGVDSAVALQWLKREGRAVHAVHLRLWPGGDRRAGGSPEALRAAQEVAAAAGVPFEVLDDAEGFERTVADPFVAAYLDGETPNPCVVCNRRRFALLARRAAELGLDGVASGHYARVVAHAGRPYAARAADLAKDQSYVLWALGEESLARLVLPLGDVTKDEVRAAARRLGLPAAARPESQEVCFAAEGYRRFLASRGVRPRRGRFVDRRGRTLGEHDGQWRFTVGQRRGIDVPGGPWYVLGRRAAENEVVVGRAGELVAGEVVVRDVVDRGIGDAPGRGPGTGGETGGAPAGGGEPLTVQLRYRSPAVPVRALEARPGGRVLVRLERPFSAAAPGQSAVFYRGARVVGGGVLDAPETSQAR